MSFRLNLRQLFEFFSTLAIIVSVAATVVFFFWAFIYDAIMWPQKTWAETLASPLFMRNFIYFVISIFFVALFNMIDNQIHLNQKTAQVQIKVNMNAQEYKKFLKQQHPAKEKVKIVKRKPSTPTEPKPLSSDLCPRQSEGYHFGFLHEAPKDAPIDDGCLTKCNVQPFCLEGKRPK